MFGMRDGVDCENVLRKANMSDRLALTEASLVGIGVQMEGKGGGRASLIFIAKSSTSPSTNNRL